jgi:hypothetical protein
MKVTKSSTMKNREFREASLTGSIGGGLGVGLGGAGTSSCRLAGMVAGERGKPGVVSAVKELTEAADDSSGLPTEEDC